MDYCVGKVMCAARRQGGRLGSPALPVCRASSRPRVLSRSLPPSPPLALSLSPSSAHPLPHSHLQPYRKSSRPTSWRRLSDRESGSCYPTCHLSNCLVFASVSLPPGRPQSGRTLSLSGAVSPPVSPPPMDRRGGWGGGVWC